MGLPQGPDDLIDGMAEFLMEVGVGSSFLDPVSREFAKAAGTAAGSWTLVTRGLLNPYSYEGKFFYENLAKRQWQHRSALEAKRRHDMARKRRLRAQIGAKQGN